MKNPADVQTPKGMLDALAKEEEDIREKTRILQRELEPKIAAAEKTKKTAAAKVSKLKDELATMKAGYFETLAVVEGEERQALEAQTVKLEDVSANKVSMQEYYKTGKTAAEIQAKAKQSAEGKTFELLKLVRAKARAVIEAEVEFYYAESELAYCISAPGLMWISGLKEFAARAEAKVNAILIAGWPPARYALEKAKEQLAQADDRGIADGLRWNSLNAAGLRELRLDPRIPEAWLPQLDAAITEIGTDETVNVTVNFRRPRHGIQVITLAAPRRSVMEEVVK
jgi:hypothetical protein